MTNLPALKIGAHTPKYPVVQGGMGVKISGAGLAGAVASYGGVGTIASVGLACDHPMFDGTNYFEINEIAMAEAVRKARELAPDGVLAVNCMVALTDYDRQVRSACEAGVDIIISGAGLPMKLPEYTKDCYYERGEEEVVCRRCDVVMNKNTIGFHGGCNPIPFPYEIRESKIFIDVRDLERHEKRFK